ncbi:MAG: exodeoxyribonuclease VII large subunit [Lunatimonas sp.]|uniref:exodeoxyribonuclease VII large subunit n=1 Tax=Lunatimonas sp. TaxID=2060141 RepID=UPI00263A6479|nr:exodeoxyribonuclease VII large subunit [Lunatimonas sp.]MCC5935804.1 exodeoxyribonuclease VII large subunit [Lunatimonas sp.]
MQPAISLQKLNAIIKSTLDVHLDPSYWVTAEIGEFRDSVRGHVYLDLVEKEQDQLVAKLRANIWSYTYQGIRKRFEDQTGEKLRSGMKILALVNVQFHKLYGLSLTVKDVDPTYTIGERAKRRQEVIDRLTKEGLINLNKQFELPTVPQRVAVISSQTAAGYGDFVNQLESNPERYRVHYTLFQATMQGKDTPSSIMAALRQIEERISMHPFDLVVIIRGGGAQTDMDSFDDYLLAKAIAESALPVVTGIGHERDECVADLVAHTKLKTPTAVASFILAGFKAFEENLNLCLTRLERGCLNSVQQEERALRDFDHRLRLTAANRIQLQREIQNRISSRISNHAKHRLKLQHVSVQIFGKEVRKLTERRLEKARLLLNHSEKHLLRLDPNTLLAKGYTRTEKNGKPIQSQNLQVGEEITTISLTKRIKSIINEIETHGKSGAL